MKASRKGQVIVERMNTAMTLSAHVNTDVEFLFAKTPTEALTAVHFAGDEVMKS